VYGAANGTDYLIVTGMVLQLERLFVQRLQQFQRGLKKQLSQFRAALIRRVRHSRTSIRR
jgi:hypothetical protein